MNASFLAGVWTLFSLHISALAFEELDIWCDYRHSAHGNSSLACGWSPDSGSEASLIITKRSRVSWCPAVFSPASTLYVTVRIRDVKTGGEVWSEPRTVILLQAVRPPRPVLTPLSDDSLLVSWTSRSDGRCRIRYRLNVAPVWTLAPDSVAVHSSHNASYALKDLLPFAVYRAAVSCRKEPGVWTSWSPDADGRTWDRAPSRPLDACYRPEETLADGSRLVRFMWKPLDPGHAGGRVLAYTVSAHPGGVIQNVTEPTAVVTVRRQDGAATVAAFNTAGYGPAAHVRINPGGHDALPSVRHMWVSSLYPDQTALCVQWRGPEAQASASPLSHYVVLWRPEGGAVSGWSAVSSFNTSTVIPDVDPDRSYHISVFPVYNQQCGPAQSLPASVQRGALVEPDHVKLLSATKTSVTVQWAWLNRSGPIRVKSYRLMLKHGQDTQTRTIWRDQDRLTFSNLTPNTQYSLQLLAGHLTTHTVQVKTLFDEKLLATPLSLLLLLVTLLMVSILSGTVFRSYCFPPISNPRDSSTYRWLKDPGTLRTEKNILDIGRFQVTEVLGEKSPIVVSPKSQLQSEEDLHQEAARSFIHKAGYRHPDQVGTAGDSGEDQDHWPHSGVQQETVTAPPFSSPAGLSDGHYVRQTVCRSESSNTPAPLGQTDGSDLVCDSEYHNISEDPEGQKVMG